MDKKLTIILSPKRLRFYRVQAEKKQYHIAEILGIERTTYNGYEKREEIEVSVTAAEAIAKLLNVPLSDLEKPTKVEKVEPQMLTAAEYINIHREVWDELKRNNKTYAESLDKLIGAVEKTMDNLSKSGNRKN